MLSIGALNSASHGADYFERDGYYGKDDPEHRAASAWFGKGAEDLGLKGPVEPEVFRQILEGRVPDGSGAELGRRGKDGEIVHRPGRDLTFSAPKSVSLAALAGGDARIVEAHDRAVQAKPDNIGGAVAARWLALSPEARGNTGVMAPSHELRRKINGHIRERLAREGRIHGPAMESERLVSKGCTNAEKAIAGNYEKGDVVAFHRPYKRIGVEKGDERRVVGVDHRAREVVLEGRDGGTVAWKPGEIGGRRGGSEVYRAEGIELRTGDRIRWTRNDAGLGLVNSRNAEVLSVADGRVTFKLEDGRKLELGRNDPQLRHLDHAWCSTVHAFQGRTVDSVIAAMEAGHPRLTTQKSFYVAISRARDGAELLTDDADALRSHLQAVTGERIAALEGLGEMRRTEAGKEAAAGQPAERQAHRGAGAGKDRDVPTQGYCTLAARV